MTVWGKLWFLTETCRESRLGTERHTPGFEKQREARETFWRAWPAMKGVPGAVRTLKKGLSWLWVTSHEPLGPQSSSLRRVDTRGSQVAGPPPAQGPYLSSGSMHVSMNTSARNPWAGKRHLSHLSADVQTRDCPGFRTRFPASPARRALSRQENHLLSEKGQKGCPPRGAVVGSES